MKSQTNTFLKLTIKVNAIFNSKSSLKEMTKIHKNIGNNKFLHKSQVVHMSQLASNATVFEKVDLKKIIFVFYFDL